MEKEEEVRQSTGHHTRLASKISAQEVPEQELDRETLETITIGALARPDPLVWSTQEINAVIKHQEILLDEWEALVAKTELLTKEEIDPEDGKRLEYLKDTLNAVVALLTKAVQRIGKR